VEEENGVSQVNVNRTDPAPPANDGSGYGFVVGIIVAILVIALVLWLLVFNQGTTPPTNGGGDGGEATDEGGDTPAPSGWRVVTFA
jgi:hypothetical protein